MTSTDIAAASKIILGTTEAVAMYIGSNKIWELQTGPVGRLPQEYTELEYIASTSNGGQYIDLNIKLYETLNTLYDIAIKFNVIGPGKDNQQSFLFGCLNVTSPWPGTFIRLNSNSATSVTSRYIGVNAKDPTLCNKNVVYELPVQTPPNKNVYNLSNSGLTHTFGTSLFCAFSNTSNNPNKFIEAKLYYFKLFVEGTLVRDMVPCKDPNNVVGLYDLVNNTFYSSPNGAAFTAGPTV